MELKKTVCYEDFGAVGDGKTDDFDAIVKAHDYANKNGLDVVTDGTKTYYIGSAALDEKTPKPAAKIKTNVDWGTSKFIIDDSEMSPLNTVSKTTLPTVLSQGSTPREASRLTLKTSISESDMPLWS